MTSTAQRLDANVRAPRCGHVICFTIAAGGVTTVDLRAPALQPPDAPPGAPTFWFGRYLRITSTGGDCTVATSKAAGDVLVPGFVGAGPVPALIPTIGVPINDAGAPEWLVGGFGTEWDFIQFASVAGTTITISESSESSQGTQGASS